MCIRDRSGVEDVHTMTLNNTPEPIRLRKIGSAFIHQDCGAVGEWPVNNITVSSHPADVCRAPVDVLIFEIKNPLGGEMSQQKITSGRVENALWFSCCT